MSVFQYQNGDLYAEGVALSAIAEQYGTPCYVYSRQAIESNWQAYDQAFGSQAHLVCYAVKANSNIAILNLLARLGSGFDIVSVGELERVLAAGGDASKVVFSGVGKKSSEIQRALEVGIKCFNVESIAELERINQVAANMQHQAPVSIRVNPDVDAGTHPYISTGLKENKFGISHKDAVAVYEYAASLSNLQVVGIDCHIGSQITEVAPFADSLERILSLVMSLKQKHIELEHIDLGGGLGICYDNEQPPSANEYIGSLLQAFNEESYEVLIEPGRSIVGNAGVLITEVELTKETEAKNFAIVDAAMNDLLRPALYQGWHGVLRLEEAETVEKKTYDLVGPICETGDFLAKDRELSIKAGDKLAITSAGAYGFSMASNYNSRPRVPEVMVDGKQFHVIRKRETISDLMLGESLLF